MKAKNRLITVSFRVDKDVLSKARANGFNVSEMVRWVIDAMATNEIKQVTQTKVTLKGDK